MADRIVAHFTQNDGDGNYGEQLAAALSGRHRSEDHERRIGHRFTWVDEDPGGAKITMTGTLVRINPHRPGEGIMEDDADLSWTVVDLDSLTPTDA